MTSTLPQSGILNAAATGTPLLPQGTWTNTAWATQLLQNVGAPTSQNNITNILQWMEAEEPPSNWWDRNNPLNASLGTSAADGTGSYPDLATAAQYTAKMIEQTNMGAILAALRSNAPGPQFSAAVVTSPWASSRYGVAAAGAPPQYVVAGRGLNYISTLAAPGVISAGEPITLGTGPTGLAGGAGGSPGGGAAGPGPTLFGIPSTPPVFTSSNDPITDLSRGIVFGFQYLGWTGVTLAIFAGGAVLMILGGVAVATVLIGPAAAPIAAAVSKKSPVGRAAGLATRAAQESSGSRVSPREYEGRRRAAGLDEPKSPARRSYERDRGARRRPGVGTPPRQRNLRAEMEHHTRERRQGAHDSSPDF